MRLAYHHFRKEALHLLPRWWLWLMLLMVELLINLGWVWQEQPTPALVAPFITWGMAFWLTASFCPADNPASINRFTATRPLPLVSFHLARVMIFVFMILLPLVVQEGCYLALMHRPGGEVVTAMLERGLLVVALFSWWLPFSVISHGKDAIKLLLTGILGVALPLLVVEFLGLAWVFWHHKGNGTAFPWAAHPADRQGLTFLAMALTLVLSILAAWIQPRGWSAPRLRLVFGGLLALASMTGFFWPFSLRSLASTDPAMLAAIQSQTPHQKNEIGVISQNNPDNWLYVTSTLTLPHLPPGVSIEGKIPTARLEQTDESAVSVETFLMPSEWTSCTSVRALAPLFPAGTLFRYSGEPDRPDTKQTVFKVPSTWDLRSPSIPLKLTTDFMAHAIQWKCMAELPLQPGAKVALPDATYRIEALQPGFSSVTGKQRDALHISLAVEQASPLLDAGPLPWSSVWVPVLYLPEKQLVWMEPRETMDRHKEGRHGLAFSEPRGVMSRWHRGTVHMSWHGVLDTKGGVENKDMEKLRLVFLRRSYLGAARWTLQASSLTIKENTPMFGLLAPILPEDQVGTWLQTLPPLPDSATPQEARERWGDLLQRASIKDSMPSLEWTNPMHMQTLVRQHPDLLFKVRTGAGLMQQTGLNKAISAAFDESQRETVVDHLEGRPWLVSVVLNRGWEQAARRAATTLIGSTMGAHADQLAIRWRTPEDIPALIQRASRTRLDPELFAYLQQFPASREPLRAVLSRKQASERPVVDEYLWKLTSDQELSLAVAAGVPEALAVSLHLARVLTQEERGRREVKQFITRLSTTIQLARPDPLRFFDLLASKQALDFHYDATQSRWIETHAP